MKLKPQEESLVEACIHELELRTSAEVVLAVREASGSYRDMAYLWGAAAVWLALLIALTIPYHIPDYWLPLPLLALFLVVGLIVHNTRARIWFVSKSRKLRFVKTAARSTFVEKNVHKTRSKTGTLVYCSFLENHVELILDQGAESALESEQIENFKKLFLERFCASRGQAGHLLALLETLRTFGVYLGRRMPASESGSRNELLNAPDFDSGDPL